MRETSCAVFSQTLFLAQQKAINMYKRLVIFFTQSLLLMLGLSALRLLFLGWNLRLYKLEPVAGILQALLVGLRFDAAALVFVLGPLLLLQLLPLPQSIFEHKAMRWFQQVWLSVGVVVLLLPNINDVEHFHFIEKRATLSMFSNSLDFFALAKPLFLEYWVYILSGFAFCGLVIKLGLSCPSFIEARFPSLKYKSIGLRSYFLILAIILSSTLVTVRGFYRRPLSPTNAILLTDSPRLAVLSLNSTYTLLRTGKAHEVNLVTFYDSEDDVFKKLTQYQVMSQKFKPSFDNVIIIGMESMGLEFLGKPNKQESRIPFLESLEDKALFFENNFSNGGETGYVFDSLLGSFPETSLGSFDGSAYSGNKMIGVGSILKKYGYQTYFFHGGPKGLFWFDIRARRMGFDQQYTLSEYENKKDFDGEWGIYDEPYFQYTAKHLTQVKEPFSAFILSLSNHPPHKLPPGYQAPNKPGWTKIDHTAYYADQALQKFFQSIETLPWFKRTLFVITGDHPPYESQERYNKDPLGRRRVPLVFYHPGGAIRDIGRSYRITQHADVLPSVIDFLGLGEKEKNHLTPFGRSVFNSEQPGMALMYHFGMYELISGKHFTALKADHSIEHHEIDSKFFSLEKQSRELGEREREELIKCFSQFSTYALINNKMYPRSFME